MTKNLALYLAVAAGVTFIIRVLPMLILQKPIKNRFVRSFLHYVPYVTLSVMVFPAIITETGSVWIGIAAMGAGILTAWISGNLFLVASAVCVVTLILGLIF